MTLGLKVTRLRVQGLACLGSHSVAPVPKSDTAGASNMELSS